MIIYHFLHIFHSLSNIFLRIIYWLSIPNVNPFFSHDLLHTIHKKEDVFFCILDTLTRFFLVSLWIHRDHRHDFCFHHLWCPCLCKHDYLATYYTKTSSMISRIFWSVCVSGGTFFHGYLDRIWKFLRLPE